MKQNITKIIILVFITLTLTGCVQFLKDDSNKNVKNPETGQALTKNILCQPAKENVKKIYEDIYIKDKENATNIKNLPKCNNYKININDEGTLWTNVFVKPLSWVLLKVRNLVKSSGLALIICAILLRLVLFPITKKSTLQSENMKKAKPEIDKLNKKYEGKTDRDAMMKKSQETMAIYKKHGVSLASGCLGSLLQIPIFFAFYEAIMRVPAVFEETFLGLQLGTTPLMGLTNGHFQYLILLLFVIGSMYFSLKIMSQSQSDEQAKQMQGMMKIMMGLIVFTSFTLSSAIGVYWVISNLFTLGQNILLKKGRLT